MSPRVKIYKVVIRNIRTGDIQFINFDKDTEEENDLKAIDKALAKYNSKEEFLSDTRINFKDSNPDDYDVYIYYNNHGSKFFDIHFDYKLSDEIQIDKLLNRILVLILKDPDFISFINQNNSNLYSRFDHYENGIFEYNKLRKYKSEFENRNVEQAYFYRDKIFKFLKKDYGSFRRLVDMAYRIFTKDCIDLTEARGKVNYSIEPNIMGQISWFNTDSDQKGLRYH